MGDQRDGGIAWTQETWNPVRGCQRESPGCLNCYAQTIAARFSGAGQPYEGLATMTPSGANWTGVIREVEDHTLDPLRWKRPRTVFVNSMSDLFYEKLPDAAIDRILAVMILASRHTFQVLTKRAERMVEYFSDGSLYTRILDAADAIRRDKSLGISRHFHEDPGVDDPARILPKHIHMGVSVESQKYADLRIPLLLKLGQVRVRWVSVEPQLGHIALGRWLGGQPRLDWVVVGGESGDGARPFHLEWARSLRDECRPAGVPFFMKQLGKVALLDGKPYPSGRKGDELESFPEDLRVREYPS